MTDDQRKVALVTGCSQPNSLGAHICLAFRQRGYRVFATCRAPLDRIRFLEEQGCEILELDMSNEGSIKTVVYHVRRKTSGTLDALVQNAVSCPLGPSLSMPEDTLTMAYKTNVLGPFLLIQLCTSMLVQTARIPGRRTCVWNTGSGAAMCPSPWALAYSSTKAALHSMTECLRYELQPLNVAVFLGAFGFIKTDLVNTNTYPVDEQSPVLPYYQQFIRDWLPKGKELNRKGIESGAPVDKAADIVVRYCDSNKPGQVVYYGTNVSIIRYLMPFFPAWLYDYIILKTSAVSSVATPQPRGKDD